MDWEVTGRAAGQGEPHTPSPGGTQPWHPDTHTFPMALPPGSTSHGPGATCQGHCTCAGSTWGGPGPPAAPEGLGLCGEGTEGDLGQLLIPVGSRIWHPHHAHKRGWDGKCSPRSLLGLSQVLGLLWDSLCSSMWDPSSSTPLLGP